MRIAIDARWIFPEISGIGAHTRELILHLALNDTDNNYILYFNDVRLRDRTWEEASLSGKPNFESVIVRWTLFSPSGQLLMPRRLRADRIDVFHSTNYMIPLLAFPKRGNRPIHCVVTIHDLIPLLFPSATPQALKTRLFPLYRRLMREVGARADRIIAVSRASRDDIIRCLRIPAGAEERVRVIHNGVSDCFRPPAGPRVSDSDDPSRTRVILYVGRSDPYKNLPALVETFDVLRRSASFPVRLRIVGPPDPRYPEPRERARQLGAEPFITWSGYMPADVLVKAYQDADVTVLPSSYEGFGFPLVDSMACGTPVVCNDIPVLREVGGDAALYASISDRNAFAVALLSVLQDPTARNTMIRRGHERARAFSWTRTARETLDIYRELHLQAPTQRGPA